ncbi:hypothetical protein, partial [Nocardia sp. NPDC058497]|uniref:hypothetical protein n=1 Tax=Nocardia sp. NPDC058497 TaxID=3346529 RepID=UPI00365DACE6
MSTIDSRRCSTKASTVGWSNTAAAANWTPVAAATRSRHRGPRLETQVMESRRRIDHLRSRVPEHGADLPH